MKRILALLALFAGVAAFSPADAASVNCKVYAAQPAATFFAVSAAPVVPCDRTGALWVNSVGAGGGGTSSNFGAAFPAAGTAGGFSDGSNMQGARVFDLDSGAGTQYGIGVDLRFIANGGSVEAGTATNPLRTDPTGSTIQPVSGTVTANQGGAPWSANHTQINGVAVLAGNGVTGTGSQRVTIASDNTSNSNPWLVNGNVTPADAAALGTTSIRTYDLNGVYNGSTVDMAREVANSTNSTGTGIAAAGQLAQCDDTSPTAITENSFGNARMDCATHAQLVTIAPSATAGGTTLFTLTLAASTNATNVKASAGQLYSISGFNMSSATPVWISLYNNSGTPTCGTAIIQQFLIPGSTTGAGFVYDFAAPKGFATGIAFCATTGIAGTGNPAASTYVLNVDYK